MEDQAATIHRPSLLRDAARLQDALGELIRVLQFRDRDRACCYDLSVSQCHALQALIQNGPMTVTELGTHLYLEKSTASRLAKALLEKELVRKRAPKADGRVVILQVTEAGHRLARKIMNDLSEEYTDLLEGFEPDVRAALPLLLDRLTRTISTRMDPKGPTCC
ncbi:MAG: MarR family transcriptional regulator [Gemmatimonadetes bacterium]|nr:MarR family transcriptional regulator [Gemmatimonadota bacterium]NNM03850.1 MarR family transcriptional regulator [Gemmatimonadota bacterium]